MFAYGDIIISFDPSAAGGVLQYEYGYDGKQSSSQLSDPRIRRYKPFSPKKLRKYHESEETQRTSMSGVSMPRCNIDLKPKVSGKGSLTR